jgi:hypothetical protein
MERDALDLGPDMFDWDEFDSPDDTELVAARNREVDFLRETAEAFVSEYQEWDFGNITNKLDVLLDKLKEYEEGYGSIKYQGYIAVKILPTIALFLCDQMQTRLPDSCQLLPEQVDGFIFQFAKLLDPHRYYDAFVNIVNYIDLLDYRTEAKWSRVVDENMANWLQTSAKAALSELAGRPVPPNESAEAREYRIKHALHLGRIARGALPFGFNSQHEQQWEMWNVDFLLEPDGDIRAEKLVTQNAYNFLLRTARERIESIEDEREKPRPSMPKEHAEKEERIYQHLKSIVETGQLPYGYRPVDMAVQTAEPPQTMQVDKHMDGDHTEEF